MELSGWIGAFAAICSVASFTPQVWKVIKTRDLSGISRRMYVITVVGFALWTAYGILLQRWPIILTNAICFVLAGFILAMRVVSQRTRDKVAEGLDPNQG